MTDNLPTPEPVPDILTVAVTAVKALCDLDSSFARFGRQFEVQWHVPLDRDLALHLTVPARVAISTDIGCPVICT